MKRIDITGADGPSAIRVGERLANLARYLPAVRPVIITDRNVERIFGRQFPPSEVIVMETGEPAKTLATVERIFERMIAAEADRSAFVLGIGGGIVCDVAGFVASTYMRGVRFGFVSTTLLAQVDASVGGKNGVNFGGFKNMVGVFNQPEFVICDLEMLKSLPAVEIQCGMAEIVKHAAIADAGMFDYLERHGQAALALEPAVVEKLVYDSVVIKSGVVNRDEKEAGERRKLNFGHTFGHAFEKVGGIPHGHAVSLGMVVAAGLSVKRGRLSPADARRIVRLLDSLHLPTVPDMDRQKIRDALGKDKKRHGGGVHFVLLDAIGSAVVEEIPLAELQAWDWETD